MDASAGELNRLGALIKRLARIKGRSVTEVTMALLSTKTLRKLGYDGSGHLTPTQAKAAIAVTEIWIERSHGQHQQR